MPLLSFFLLSCLLIVSCNAPQAGNEPSSAARAIIDQAIAAHGGKKFEALEVAFDFRGRHYRSSRKGGLYTYERAFHDSTGAVKDVLNNQGFTRTINGTPVHLPEERVEAFTSSVNSVLYFALLPFGLNDPAVIKQLVDTVTIHQVPYLKVKVSFKAEGGGKDFQDEFLYWVNQKTHTMDYLAYTYATDGGGIRFRQAVNARQVAGIRFQDYINYEAAPTIDFLQIDRLFEAGQLKELSRIELENLQVKPLAR
ncbi:MAG: DUF6503 family protein [Adhaeribacter sp.]